MTPDTQSVATWRTYTRLAPFLRPYLGRLAVVIVISLFSTALSLAQPYLSKLMIDRALLRADMRALLTIAAAMVIVTIAGYALNILASYRYISASAAMLFDIRVAILRHLQRLSPRFYGSFRLGDLLSRLNGDVSEIQRVTADGLLSILSNVLMLGGCIAAMLWLDWRLFVIGVILVPFCVLALLHYQKRLTRLTAETRERGADLGSLLVDTIMGMRVVTALRAGEHEVGRFGDRNQAFVGTMLRLQVTSFMAGAVPGTLLTMTSAGAVLYGGMQIIAGKMTIGTLVAFMAYQSRLFGPVQALMGLMSGLSSARVSLARLFVLLDARIDVVERADPVALPAVSEAIRFEHVSMAQGGRPVLTDVGFAIPAGAFCAILGPSGVGKSTMADLMARYLDPDGGRVLIGDRDLRDFRIDDLRREIILVDQSPHLFNDTIGANIAFALPGATPADIALAARHAGLDALIAKLPDGLETRAGERGLALSVGERQRIALARALLRRPSVLILDEPSAALDEETEKLIAQGLRLALPDATIVVITHKPALAQMADMVVTLDDGRVTIQPIADVALA
ncbi:ABC transporter ATP-binding protein [Sphingomonas sp. MMS24-J13]|uniref:ABC transporter ATP-binding protein n=1 Tax=Sphingomonas sp. MMS24-J13 TaxID=3238686 RepID=UPI003850452E